MADKAPQLPGGDLPLHDRVSRFRVSPAVAELATTATRVAIDDDSLSPCVHPGAVLVCGRHQRTFCPGCWTEHWAQHHDVIPLCDVCDQPGADFVHLAVSAGRDPADQYEVTGILCAPCRGS